MKQIAYVVTSGSYSDYGIDGVFSTKEKAQEFIDMVIEAGHSNEPGIEEWEIDGDYLPHGFQRGLKSFCIRMKENGDAVECNQNTVYGMNHGNPAWDVNNDLFMWVYAKDEKHAVKIVNEKRAMIIANNEWGKR